MNINPEQINNIDITIRHNYPAQPYHLVTPSPWPILTSFALLILTVSTVLYCNGYATPIIFGDSFNLIIIGFITTIGAIILWFRDVVIESTYLGDHTLDVQEGINISFILFIISEIFFFLSVFWAFFHSSLSPNIELGSQWPPSGIATINPFELPLVNTILLLTSGATLTYGHHSLINNNRQGIIIGTIITVILAIVFTYCQSIEYINAGFTITDGIYGSTFYFATGFHGIHVIIGTAFIIVGLVRILNYHFTDYHHIGFETSILYWHLVDFVWLRSIRIYILVRKLI